MIRNFQANGTTANTVSDAVSLGDAAGGNAITIAGAGMQLRATTAAVAVGEIMRFGQDQTISSTANATTAVGLVNTTIDNLGTRLATWGAGSKRLDVHKTFIGKLQDALSNGIGAIVDADLASNSLGWQWAAGCGADAAPYFRIFNPTSQAEKFDADAAYIKRWVPELARVPAKFALEPWDAPPLALATAGVTLGEEYPRPIVDHAKARERALAALAAVSRKGGVPPQPRTDA
jgi:hypothetical protein